MPGDLNCRYAKSRFALEPVLKECYPDLVANTNQAFFAMEVLNGCFPMFYDDIGAYYRQITLDASNFGWMFGQSNGSEVFADAEKKD